MYMIEMNCAWLHNSGRHEYCREHEMWCIRTDICAQQYVNLPGGGDDKRCITVVNMIEKSENTMTRPVVHPTLPRKPEAELEPIISEPQQITHPQQEPLGTSSALTSPGSEFVDLCTALRVVREPFFFRISSSSEGRGTGRIERWTTVGGEDGVPVVGWMVVEGIDSSRKSEDKQCQLRLSETYANASSSFMPTSQKSSFLLKERTK